MPPGGVRHAETTSHRPARWLIGNTYLSPVHCATQRVRLGPSKVRAPSSLQSLSRALTSSMVFHFRMLWTGPKISSLAMICRPGGYCQGLSFSADHVSAGSSSSGTLLPCAVSSSSMTKHPKLGACLNPDRACWGTLPTIRVQPQAQRSQPSMPRLEWGGVVRGRAPQCSTQGRATDGISACKRPMQAERGRLSSRCHLSRWKRQWAPGSTCTSRATSGSAAGAASSNSMAATACKSMVCLQPGRAGRLSTDYVSHSIKECIRSLFAEAPHKNAMSQQSVGLPARVYRLTSAGPGNAGCQHLLGRCLFAEAPQKEIRGCNSIIFLLRRIQHACCPPCPDVLGAHPLSPTRLPPVSNLAPCSSPCLM